MSSVIDTNLPPVGRDQGTKRKYAAPEGGKENQVGQGSKVKSTKKVKVTEPTKKVRTTDSVLKYAWGS